MTDKPTYEELEQRVRELELLESERKQMEESLRSLNEHLSFYRNAVGSMDDYKIAVVDKDYRYRIVSPQYLKIYNLTGAEIVGKTVAEIMGDDVFEHAIKPNLDRAKKGRAVHYSDWFKLSDKGKRYLEISYYPVVDEDQEVVSIVALSHDITEKRRVDEALCESETKYRSLTENMNDILWATDLGMNTTYASPSIEKVLGFTVEERLKQPHQEQMTPGALQMAAERLTEELKFDDERDPERYTYLELDYYHKDGSVRCLEATLSFIRDEHGKPAGIHGMSRDITARKRVEEELIRQKVRFESLFTNTNDAIVFIDEEHKIIDINYQFTRLFGYDFDEIKGLNINSVVDPGGMADNIYASPRFLSGEKVEMEAVRYNRNGEPIDVLLKGAPIYMTGRIAGGYAIYTDIRGKKQAEKSLLESRNRLEAIVSSLEDAVFLIDPATRLISEFNDATVRIFGYSREELAGRESSFLHVDQAHFEQFGNDATATYEDPGYYATEFRMRRKDGSVFPTEHFVRPVRDSDGGVLYVVSVVRDITERKQAEEKIHQMAYYDSLTGLPNRDLFSDRLAVALARARRNRKNVAVAWLDLDNFKDVNDNLGHDAGDLLLKAAAERLNAALRESDTVARFGGDEFVLVLPDLKEADDAIPVARKIVESFRSPFLIGAHQLLVTTSMGMAVHPDDGTKENILLKNADSAMYQAKKTGRNRYQIYNKG